MHSGDDVHQVCDVHVYVHNTHKERPTLIAEDKDRHSTQLFPDIRVVVLDGVVVSPVAWPEAHVFLVLLETGDFQWSLVQHVPGFLPWMLVGRPLLFTLCVHLGVCRYYVAVWEPGLWGGNALQVSAGNSDTPQIHCAEHVQQSIDTSIRLPMGPR